MKGVSTIQQFRAVLNTCKFWGDTWAISTLERALNTKSFILFSEENFDSGDIDNVLQCGQLNDEELEKRGSFTPDILYIRIIMDGTINLLLIRSMVFLLSNNYLLPFVI